MTPGRFSPAVAATFFAGLTVAIGVLTFALARRWGRHRRSPNALSGRARALWRKTGLRWSPPAYLTVHTILGLAIAVAGVAVFSTLADWIVDQSAITRFDVQFDDRLHALATPAGLAIARGLSLIGGPAAMTALMVAGAIVLLVRRSYLVLYAWLIAFAGGGVLDWALKTIFHRARPAFPQPYVHALGFSFPSGHAMGSLIGIGMLAYLVTRQLKQPRLDRPIAVVAAVLILCIGFSRLYLGAHFPSDVLGGFAAGLVWLTACISAVEAAAGSPPA